MLPYTIVVQVKLWGFPYFVRMRGCRLLGQGILF